MLVLSAQDVERLLDPDGLVDALAAAMRDASEGRASVPPRVAARIAERDGMLLAMPAYLPSANVLAAKLVTQFPHNTEASTHQALVCCFDPEDGTPLAVMDGEYLTAARTAAGSVLAARYLARADARTVAIIGSGTQARSHAAAFARRPGIETVLVAARDRAKANTIDNATVVDDIKDAVRQADIVCLTTHADRPVIDRSWLRSDAHVSSVGYNTAGTGEVDAATVAAALVVVETRASALAAAPSGAVELAGLDPEQVVEIGEIVADPAVERGAHERLTLYKSVGVGVQDAAAAALVLNAARRSSE
ncbi:MAG TPA: ornithine cyclodeaminase family protein [Jatrophihabitans sp.]|jgi:ornithine cyclodeaminase